MKKTGFSKNIERLESIVGELEAGPLELEKALQLFEEGIKLSAACQQELDKASAKVSMLVQGPDSTLVLVPENGLSDED